MNTFKNLLEHAVTSAARRINAAVESSRNPSSSSSSPGHVCPVGGGGGGEDCICHNPEHLSDWHAHEIQQYQQLCSGNQCSWIIPFGGNAYICSCTSDDVPLLNSGNQLNPNGLVNWSSSQTKVSLFVHCEQPGIHLVALRLQVPGKNSSRIRVSLKACDKQGCAAPQIQEISLAGNKEKSYQIVPCGQFSISTVGYFKLDLEGLQKSGPVFADISHAILIPVPVSSRGKRSVSLQSPSESPPPVLEKTNVKFVSDPGDFYFGRRGPSVHLNYVVPNHHDGGPRKLEYFYNEVMVPVGQDVVGAYFCAIGFSGGYFGIQVNSATERRILFSIWSAYNTDNPQEIPKDFKVTLKKKGSDVHVGEFGNEGSGGQSYLRYSWKSSRVYKFIVRAKPLDEESTLFSAWFCESTGDSENDEWRLVASFRKPKVSTHLQGLYSFSENFIPEMGHVERYCIFGNQWAWDVGGRGEWVEVTKVKFTADASAMKGTRKDVAAGLMEGESGFYLRNCGFFSDSVEPGKEFCRRECRSPPRIEFASLP